ncbi:MAG TPA: ABC-F family ATP-binding cassette domain-containing protein [Rhizomicrobium sp.]|jgi:ATPase subunit of ABC transporter with duplicated ATPase domains|nr:ABC-F family ATP-binding cassette domain-containing protein [Rhizomicrobium sp.]
MAARQAVLGIDRGGFQHGVKTIFENVSFLLDDARTALVGDNGAGKSTLLKCLAGEYELGSGTIVKSRGSRIGYVPQEIPTSLNGVSVRDMLEGALPADARDDTWKVDVLLDDLRIPFEIAEKKFGELSGGWQRLLLIAAAKLGEPDIVILDEPTNHLDIENINKLERWLEDDIRLPMLIVSHDREFLDKMTTRTIFLRHDGAHTFKVPFSVAREELLRRDATAAAKREQEDKEIARLHKMAMRYKAWGVLNDAFHKKQRTTEKRIARIEDERADTYVAKKRKLELNDDSIDAKVALRLQNMVVTVPDGSRTLITIDRLVIGAGDRVALLGVNGSGKSTLLSALAAAYDPNQEHYDGRAAVRFNPATNLVYFDQRMADLPLNISLLDYISDIKTINNSAAVTVLAKAGFPFERMQAPIRGLSYGEQSRLVFLRMKLLKPNFYLLDEPTNHLDIEGQEDLEEQLEESDVSCIFVSHDRFFTRTAATRFLEIRRGRLVEVEDADTFFDQQVERASA